jgi:hypothetical protein
MSLIAHYRLDGNANDDIGLQNGTATGSVSYAAGKMGDSFVTGASLGRIDTTIPDSTFASDFSASAWVRIKQWGLSQGVFGTRTSPNGWMLYRNPGDANGLLRFYMHYTNTSDVDSTTSHTYTSFPLDEWFHVVVIRSHTGWYETWFNGALVAGRTTASSFKQWNSNGNTMDIGGGGDGWTTSQMDIDDVRIYNHILSTKEIKELAKAKVLHYKFEDDVDVSDSSAQQNHGTNSGCVLSSDSRIGNTSFELDGSGTNDGTVAGDHVILDEDITNTNNYPDGCTYSIWLNADTDAADRMSLFWGAGTVRHIEIYSSSKNFRTEAALENNYSFGTGSFPDNVRGVWSHFAIVFANAEATRPVRWYQNGVLFHTGSLDGGSNPGTEYFSFSRIGRSTGSVSFAYAPSFDGKIDDFRIYATALTVDEINEIYQTRASVDGIGNVHNSYIQELSHQPLFLDYTIWENGQTGSVGEFGQNGDTTENYRILGNDPWGKETVVWEARPDAVSDADGGWNQTAKTIDNTKLYRFSTWVNRTVQGSSGTFYLGLNGFGSVNGVLHRDDGTTNQTNPYFYAGALPTNEWVLVVGHVWPAGSGAGSDHPDSGRYTVDGNKYGTITRDFIWRAETTTGRHRSYLYYSTDTSVRQRWVYPRVDIIDGTEPSIQDLLGGFDSKNIDYLRLKGGTTAIPLNVETSSTFTNNISEVGPTRGLLLYLPFFDDADDHSEFNLTTSVPTALTKVPGVNDAGAYQFNGTNNTVDFSTSYPSAWTDNFTIACWVYVPTGATWANGFYSTVVGRGSYGGSYGLIKNTTDNSIGILCRGDAALRTAFGTITRDTWHHIAGVWNGDRAALYIDGSVVSSSATGGNTGVPDGGSWRVGGALAYSGNTGAWFEGTIDDVRIYDRELSAAEVSALYFATAPTSDTKVKVTTTHTYLRGEIKE